MSSMLSVGGGAHGSKPEYVSSGYDPFPVKYDEMRTEEPGVKNVPHRKRAHHQHQNQRWGCNDDEDSDTDDSDEELGNMIYESSRTAKKFREQEAERKKVSQSHEGNTK